jgi:hypothetical protein
MKHLYLIFVVIFSPILTFGQGEYIASDSAVTIGIKLIDGGHILNSSLCQVRNGTAVIKYSPYEIKEFGFKNGRIYKSFPIKIHDTISSYFLERLVEGKVELYYLRAKEGIKKYYLVEGDSTNPIEIPRLKEKYYVLFDSIVKGCVQAVNNIPFIKFNKYCFIRFLEDYNNCVRSPLPRFRYGLEIGINANQLSAVDKGSVYSIPDYQIDLSISIGAVMDIPVKFSNFSFHPEIYFNRYSISKAFKNEDNSNDLIINYSSICFPLLFRYSLLSKRISPYFQLGPAYSRAIKNDGTLYEYESNGNDIFINIIDSPILHKDLLGFSVGSGLILNYGSNHSWFSEVHYSRYYNLGQGSKLLNLSGITLDIGLIF